MGAKAPSDIVTASEFAMADEPATFPFTEQLLAGHVWARLDFENALDDLSSVTGAP